MGWGSTRALGRGTRATHTLTAKRRTQRETHAVPRTVTGASIITVRSAHASAHSQPRAAGHAGIALPHPRHIAAAAARRAMASRDALVAKLTSKEFTFAGIAAAALILLARRRAARVAAGDDLEASTDKVDTGATPRRTAGKITSEGVPEFPDELVERLRQYQNTRGASFQSWLEAERCAAARAPRAAPRRPCPSSCCAPVPLDCAGHG